MLRSKEMCHVAPRPKENDPHPNSMVQPNKINHQFLIPYISIVSIHPYFTLPLHTPLQTAEPYARRVRRRPGQPVCVDQTM